MFIIEAANARIVHYLVEQTPGTYRWVAGEVGLRDAKRFRTQDEAARVKLRYLGAAGALSRVVPVPPVQRQTTNRGLKKFIIVARGSSGIYYLINQEGRFLWRHGAEARKRAMRFGARAQAEAVIDGGYHSSGGADAEVVEVQD